MGKALAALFVGVFVGALTYEIVKKSKIASTAVQKVSNGLESAKKAFQEGYRSVEQATE